MGKNDLTGERHGRLTVLHKTNEVRKGRILYAVQCDCGVIKKMDCVNFRTILSCGCLKAERNQVVKEHGLIQKDMKPSTAHFDYEVLYSFTYSECSGSLVGRLINEYSNTACFEVTELEDQSDFDVISKLHNRVIVRKEDAFIYDTGGDTNDYDK